jgi:hypothetical protein
MNASLFALLLVAFAAAQTANRNGPVVFIGGEGSDPQSQRDVRHTSGDDQTMEVARVMMKSCPEIDVTRSEQAADYFLLINRGKEYGLFANAVTQVMLLDPKQKVLYANKEGTVAKAVKDGCRAIMSDWQRQQRHEDSAVKGPETPTK